LRRGIERREIKILLKRKQFKQNTINVTLEVPKAIKMKTVSLLENYLIFWIMGNRSERGSHKFEDTGE